MAGLASGATDKSLYLHARKLPTYVCRISGFLGCKFTYPSVPEQLIMISEHHTDDAWLVFIHSSKSSKCSVASISLDPFSPRESSSIDVAMAHHSADAPARPTGRSFRFSLNDLPAQTH